jgi:hypothetical protein
MVASALFGFANSMNLRHFGRAQQMWVLVAACFSLFALFLLLVPGMTFALWWPSMVAALVRRRIGDQRFQAGTTSSGSSRSNKWPSAGRISP